MTKGAFKKRYLCRSLGYTAENSVLVPFRYLCSNYNQSLLRVNKYSKNRCRSFLLLLQLTGDIASHSIDDNNSSSIEDQIAYHKQMEYIANRSRDFTKADPQKDAGNLHGLKRIGAMKGLIIYKTIYFS